MQTENYFQPDSCIPGKVYFIKTKYSDSTSEYKSVRFVGYCPHPAEVIIREGSRNKVIHRIYLLEKNGKE